MSALRRRTPRSRARRQSRSVSGARLLLQHAAAAPCFAKGAGASLGIQSFSLAPVPAAVGWPSYRASGAKPGSRCVRQPFPRAR